MMMMMRNSKSKRSVWRMKRLRSVKCLCDIDGKKQLGKVKRLATKDGKTYSVFKQFCLWVSDGEKRRNV